jgi:DNA-binding transcriptional ArsR family regulator
MPPAHTPEPEYLIDDLETLKVLSDPRRMAILEELDRAGEGLTVKQVGEALGEDPSKLYYHVRLLERHGLIVVVATRLVSGIVEKQYGLRARTFQISHALLTTTSEGGQPGLLATFLDSTRDEMEDSLRAGLLHLDAPEAERTAICQKAHGMRLSPERARELRGRLLDLLAEFDDPAGQDRGPDAQAYTLLVTLYPLAPRSKSETHSAEDSPEANDDHEGEAE